MESHLRQECWSLLQQLQNSQQQLRNKLDSNICTSRHAANEKGFYREKSLGDLYDENKVDGEKNNEVKSQRHVGKDVSVNVYSYDSSTSMPNYARTRLAKATKSEQGTYPNRYLKENMSDKDVRDSGDGISRAVLREINSDLYESQYDDRHLTGTKERPSLFSSGNGNTRDFFTSTENKPDILSTNQFSPDIKQRRQLIDKHTAVPTKLNSEELKDLDDERRLNFNYSTINFDDTPTFASVDQKDKTSSHTKNKGKKTQFVEDSAKVNAVIDTQKKSSRTSTSQAKSEKVKQPAVQQSFRDQLEDDGNSRKLNHFVKDSTIKAKSKLNSTLYDGSKSLMTERSTSDQRLLGYDWIAALLDNESGLIKQSEGFFDELRDFRKAYKDECCNQFYMEGPHTLVDYEPEPVGEAISASKVKPYFVNDRLFTEPLRLDLIDREERAGKTSQREPDEQKPRFVRVSIPRSTLQTPYKVKPHRRRSFDSLDSCGLMDHCLLGWENTRPAMIPTASALDLNTEAGTGVDWQKTTLAEAERLATTTYDTNLPTTKCLSRLHILPTWRKCYMDTTLNLSVPSFKNTDLSTTRASGGQGGTKSVTDELMNSTYSMMFEMQRLKQERHLEAMANTKK